MADKLFVMGDAAKKYIFGETVISEVAIAPVSHSHRGLRFGPAANIFKRSLAQVIDEVLVFTFAYPIFLAQIFIYPLIFVGINVPQTEGIVLAQQIFAGFITFCAIISYYYFQYRYKCTTIGKRIFNYRVYKFNSSEPIGIFKIINRDIFGKLISLALFPISIYLFYRSKEKRFLHDYLANTQVIKEDIKPID